MATLILILQIVGGFIAAVAVVPRGLEQSLASKRCVSRSAEPGPIRPLDWHSGR
jgi:hypothetical protein